MKSNEGQKIDFHVRSGAERRRGRQPVQPKKPERLARSILSTASESNRGEHAVSIASAKGPLRRMLASREQPPLPGVLARELPSSPMARKLITQQAGPSSPQQGIELPEAESLLKRLFDEGNLSKLIDHLKIRGTYSSIVGNKTIGDLAAEKGNCRLLSMLKEALNYDFNRRNKDEMLPFHYATKKRQISALLQLVELGARPDELLPALTGKGQSDTALHLACSMADEALLTALLEHCKASLYVVDFQGNSPLHRACLEDSLKVVKILGPHITERVLNMPGFDGKTALHIAVLNQNREIVRCLLNLPGALVDIPANNGKTVIDIILELNNHMMLSDFVHYYTVTKMGGIQAKSLSQLSHNEQFDQYLQFLANIDDEFGECIMPELKKISEDDKTILCEKLRDDDRIDLIEFTEVILQLVQTENIHDLIDEDEEKLIQKIVENIVHYILFREDTVLLERIMACGILWSKVAALIEAHIDSLYLQAPEREVNGIVKHFRDRFVVQDSVNYDELAKHYGEWLSCYRLSGNCEGIKEGSPYMRNPLKTLPVWSILSGRLCLTELLLQQEKFDVVPLSLFCAGLLRTFPKNKEIVVDKDSVEDLALTCERFARKVVEKVHTIDTSYKHSVSLDYLLRPMESYGGVSCVRLAASNSCAVFLQSELCQHALDKMWFRSLLNVDRLLREFVIWLGAIPMNFVVPLILMYFDSREAELRQKHEERPLNTDDTLPQRSAKFHLRLLESAASKTDNTTDVLGWNSDGEASIKQNIELRQFGNYSPQRMQPDTDNATKSHLVGFDQDREDCTSLSTNFQQQSTNTLCHGKNLLMDFYSTPGVKFRYHVASHLVLLTLMSYFLLIEFKYQISSMEIIVYAIIATLLLEEIGEAIQYFYHNDTKSYLNSKWNMIDICALLSGGTGFVIRVVETKHSPDWTDMMRDFEDPAWYIARICLSICCTLYWIRLLYVSNVLENLGPKLKMIAKMITQDLLPFLLILFIFIIGFGVLMHSLLYPNGYRAWNSAQIGSAHILLGMLRICFYSMVGDYGLDAITGDESCDNIYQNLTQNEGNCPHKVGRYLVPYLVLPLYVIVTEILLLNLIIAMFSKTIETIDSRSTDLWQFERYDLIEEFETRSSLPPPLNVFALLIKLCRRLCRAEKELGFNRRVVLKFLLFQAFGLRNNRLKLMEQSLPKQETEDEKMLMKIRKIVEQEVSKLNAQTNRNLEEEESESDFSITTNTLLGAGAPSRSRPRRPLQSLAQSRWRQALRLNTMWR